MRYRRRSRFSRRRSSRVRPIIRRRRRSTRRWPRKRAGYRM